MRVPCVVSVSINILGGMRFGLKSIRHAIICNGPIPPAPGYLTRRTEPKFSLALLYVSPVVPGMLLVVFSIFEPFEPIHVNGGCVSKLYVSLEFNMPRKNISLWGTFKNDTCVRFIENNCAAALGTTRGGLYGS